MRDQVFKVVAYNLTRQGWLQACNEAPFVVGMCRAIEMKWSYNPDTAACEEFTYGGCGGTANNFNSEKECKKTCCEDSKNEEPGV